MAIDKTNSPEQLIAAVVGSLAGGVNGEISGCPVSLSGRVNGDRLGQVVWSSSEYTGLRSQGL